MESLTSEVGTVKPDLPMNVLVQDVPFEKYAAHPGINSSGLKAVLRSPAHYLARKNSKDAEMDTPALRFGRVLHMAILESTRFLASYVVRPRFDKRTKAGKEQFAEFEDKLKPDAVIVEESDVEMLLGMIEKVRSHPMCQTLLKDGVREATLIVQDPETGEICKSRPDMVTSSGAICVDLKGVRDARQRQFAMAAFNYDWDLQCAHYLHCMKTAGLSDGTEFVFVAVEKERPWEIAVFPAGASMMRGGEVKRRAAMAAYSKAKATNVWGGYNQKAITLEMPQFAEYTYEQIEKESES